MLRRTALFIPGNNPAMLLSANILGADSVILDLEDAVALNQKDSARMLVKKAITTFDFTGIEVLVRINPVSTPFWQDDLREIIEAQPDGLVIPKATKDDVMAIEALIEKLEEKYRVSKKVSFLLIAESAIGVETIAETLACSKRITGVLLGAEDLTADMEIVRRSDGEEIDYARKRVVMACKAFKVQPMDTPYTDVDNFDGLVVDTEKAKALGYTAKAVINPRQIDFVHQVFAPTQAEIDYAVAVLQEKERAFAEGIGVFSYQGKMVDQPIILRAEKILAMARKLGLIV
jgi:citrate lyase subunit beta / citryl-CoA lyase